MSRWHLFVLLLTLYFFRTAAYFGLPQILGPADFVFKTLEECEDVKQPNDLNVSITPRKYNRSLYVYDAVYQSKFAVDDNLRVEFKGSLKKEGGFKQGSFSYSGPLCETFRILIGDIMDDFLKAVGVNSCPIPAGSYYLHDFIFDNTKFIVPQLYGDFKMTLSLWEDKQLIRCYIGYYEFVPKE